MTQDDFLGLIEKAGITDDLEKMYRAAKEETDQGTVCEHIDGTQFYFSRDLF